MTDRRNTKDAIATSNTDRADESQKRGGYLASPGPCELPQTSPGPAQGGTSNTSSTDNGNQSSK